MKIIQKKARAKINLCLNVLKKLDDWYHTRESVAQIIDLYDEISIEKIEWDNLELICNWKELENDSNIMNKAYELLKKTRTIYRGCF